MKILLSLVLLLSFNAYAALELDFDIFVRSGDEEHLATDLKEALETSKVELIQHIHIFRQDRDTSFLRISTHGLRQMRDVLESYKGGHLKILNAFEAIVVRTYASLQAPEFISHTTVSDKPIITYGYYEMRRAFELKEPYLNFHRLSLNPSANAKKFKAIAATAPSDIASEQVVQAKTVHDSLLEVLKDAHALKPLGVTCGQLYCSCNGLINCEVTRLACLKLHDNNEDFFKCLDTDKARGKCRQATCQIITIRP